MTIMTHGLCPRRYGPIPISQPIHKKMKSGSNANTAPEGEFKRERNSKPPSVTTIGSEGIHTTMSEASMSSATNRKNHRLEM